MARIGTGAALVGALALALTGYAFGAPAGTARPLHVKGTQTIVNEAKGTYTMHGDLVGSWRVTAFTTNYQGADGRFVGSGKELFSGCRDTNLNGACGAGEPKGTIRLTFVYWASFNPKTKALVSGRCVHPVTGGTGAFAGIKGIIHMTDTPAAGGVETTYVGSLTYGGQTPAAVGAVPGRTLAGRGAAVTCGG
jgi:hypothetical protein